jgi:hypothetical protein
MKRRVNWIILACVVGVAAVIAWRLTSQTEELTPPQQPYVTEIASSDTVNAVPTERTAMTSAPTNALIAPLRDRTAIATTSPPPPISAITSSPAPRSFNSAPQDNAGITTDGRRVSPRSLEGGSVDPITGQPEREIIGIGAVLARDNGALRIRDVLPGSPAALANLSGCVIQSVDGVNITELPLAECVRMIRGLEGSTVKLEVIDPAQQRQTVEIVRNKVQL